MNLKGKLKHNLKVLDKVLDRRLGRFTLPGFHKKSIYQVLKFFVYGLFEEDLSLRASSLAFNFFLAVFPAIIFLFTLIPYIPLDNLQDQIYFFLEKFLPSNAFDFLNETITDILRNKNTGLLSFGFIAAIYFSSNGFASMLSAFDSGVQRKLQRNWFDIRLKSMGLMFVVFSLLIITILMLVLSDITINMIESSKWLNGESITLIVKVSEMILTVLLVYFIYSSIYFIGSTREARWKFFTAGSTLATFLSLIATKGFAMYVENFNSYNKLYGSVGTLLVIMVLIYFNSFVVLIGFELNRSIDKVELKR